MSDKVKSLQELAIKELEMLKYIESHMVDDSQDKYRCN